jgi:hypothetical protein
MRTEDSLCFCKLLREKLAPLILLLILLVTIVTILTVGEISQLIVSFKQCFLLLLFSLECGSQNKNVNVKGKRSLDFKTGEGESNKENRHSQLLPRGGDLDVSFVAPLDQSVNGSIETEQLVENGTTGQQSCDTPYNGQLNNHNSNAISDNFPTVENGEARKRGNVGQQMECDTGKLMISPEIQTLSALYHNRLSCYIVHV